ncbi:MAG: mechanosensitive ion channel [Gammaproteobacteria bacterium]|nr:mechanosensitive ion channel [Gammaproteobacteria bacterium]
MNFDERGVCDACRVAEQKRATIDWNERHRELEELVGFFVNTLVLRTPEPQVFFLGFGESSLDFELRVFSPDVGSLLPIRHQLHMAIDRAFRTAGIEIAFPQRDLHLRDVPRHWTAGAPADRAKDADGDKPA